MDVSTLLSAVFLGIVEGVTEFIPVSSTGHLILIEDLIGFQGPPGKVFEIAIQLGAILAVCWLYREKLMRAALDMFSNPDEFRFARNVVLAFIPTAIVGFLAYSFIKRVLFSPWVVSVTLILGGIAILAIERDVEDRAELGLHLQALAHARLDTAVVTGNPVRGSVLARESLRGAELLRGVAAHEWLVTRGPAGTGPVAVRLTACPPSLKMRRR